MIREISREEMLELPIARYEGDVCLVRTSADMERALHDFQQETVVGFDTETRPSFKSTDRHLPALMQAATAQRVYLFRLQHTPDLTVPAALLANAATLKVGVALADDIRALRQLHPFEAAGMLDLGDVARKAGLKQTGVRNLAGLFLKVRIPKGIKTSNWAAPRLSPAQIGYAATDAWICRELYLRFVELGIISG